MTMNIIEIPGTLNESHTGHAGTECPYSPQIDLPSALFMSIQDLYAEDQMRYLIVCENGTVQCIVGRQGDAVDVVASEEALAHYLSIGQDFNDVLDRAWEEANQRFDQFTARRPQPTTSAHYATLKGVRNDN